MLIKEYRVLMPLSVEEYKIAQLYMIQKMSRLESGQESGVEIMTNEPYHNGPGGDGQYTFKIYHVGNRLPAWIRSLLPSAVMRVHEEAWNAYPFTRTRYSMPVMDRFSIEIETLYFNDIGEQSNVFNLSESDLKKRIIDVIDFVKEPVPHDCTEDEDPKTYQSKKTGRGPLMENWVEEFTKQDKKVMCAYKLCKVNFQYWGMQDRIERWVHDLALRGMLVKSHLRAWIWQDEWVDLTMEDIRKLEIEAADYLSKIMNNDSTAHGNETGESAVVESDSSSDIFFDCSDITPSSMHKPSLIRWNSELLVGNGFSPPSTPKLNSSLLVLVFHGDVYPESPADTKTTDSVTLRSTIETLVLNHYPHLKNKIHVYRVTCGSELGGSVSQLTALCPSFGAFHPSLGLLLASNESAFFKAVYGTIKRANEVVDEFFASPEGQDFSGEIFAVGDCIGGILMYEAFAKRGGGGTPFPVSRHSSSVSSQSRVIPENRKDDSSTWSLYEYEEQRHFSRNLSAPPSATYYTRKKHSTASTDTMEINDANFPPISLSFHPSTAFLLGCPLALVLTQQKLAGREIEELECNQLFNLFYSLDTCGARLEPVLNPQLALLEAVSVPRYQRYPLGDGRHILFENNNAMETSTVWGSRRIDHQLYCPPEMVTLPSSALPNILHASYWENKDVGAFILRQFVRADDAYSKCLTLETVNIPLNINTPTQWKRRRSRFKVANLSPNHRANDIIVIEGNEQVIHAKFYYGPMDLVALSRENVSIYVCPYSGQWYHSSTETTDNHGRLTVNLGKRLPVGIHSIKMIVNGDHSYLDMFIGVVPQETKFVVFSIDGSLTGSVSFSGRDPKVRPGAVDVVRFWQQQGYLIIYVTARPDMQQRVVSSWMAQHNFPHGFLFFTPSLSTDPLRHKTQHLRHLVDLGIRIQAAYGSNKDVTVYTAAGVDADRIYSVSSSKRRGCVSLDDGYALHLQDLQSGRIASAQRVINSLMAVDSNSYATFNHESFSAHFIQRTQSFTPRSGKCDTASTRAYVPADKKSSQVSVTTR